jgi:ribosomal protein L37E
MLTRESEARLASAVTAKTSSARISLEIDHTKCRRCGIWSRRVDSCPNCGAPKDRSGHAQNESATR